MSFFLTLVMLCSFSMATMTIERPDCPVKFEGRVKDIIEEIGPSNAFSTQTVIFKNLQTISGKVQDQVAVEMLQHGPFELKHGEDYRIQLREGRICLIENL